MQHALNAFDLTPEQVRDRFGWAVRQGQPQWLWPDVTIEQWHAALTQIESIARGVLNHRAVKDPLDGDPGVLGVACYTSGMGPLLGYWLEQGAMSASAPVGAMLDLHLRHNRLRMEKMTAHAVHAVERLSAQGMKPTLLKGMHTAHCYFPEPGTRPLSDIDLLVGAADEPAANAVLRELGYRPEPRSRRVPRRTWFMATAPTKPRCLSFVHADDPWSVDLHLSLNRRYSDGARLLRLDDVSTGLEEEHWRISEKARVLPQPLLLLKLASHASCGLQSMTLLRLVELVFVIRRDTQADILSWHDFLRAAERSGALGMVYPALKLCEQLVPGTIPENVRSACARETPRAVREIVDGLTPANAHRVVRCSLAERFMWTPSRAKMARQILLDLVPPRSASLSKLVGIYRARAWRLARRTLTQ